MKSATRLLCQLTVLVALDTGIAFAQTPAYSYEIIRQYPHDTTAFTEGLQLVEGVLYESTGLVGSSELREVDLTTGAVLRRVPLAPEYFGEGMTRFQGKIFVLTYRSQTALVYDPATFAQVGTFSYPGEGWGLTHDDEHLIMSDGTNQIRFLDPSTFQPVRTISVHDNQGNPVPQINELEYVNGDIYANIWPTPWVARIDALSGQVLGWIDFTALWPTGGNVDVLNGIAYDESSGHLLLTGKWWPTLYEVQLTADAGILASDQTVRTLEDTAQDITLSVSSGNGDGLTFTVTSPPAHGVLSGTAPFVVYTPSANYSGTDAFTFTASDGVSSSNVATVTIVVAPVNDAPLAVNDSYSTSVDTTIAGAAPGVLINDSDIDDDTLTAVLVTGPSHGALTLSANGSFTYTPAAGFTGTDLFTYVAHDGSVASPVATASIAVSGPSIAVSPTSLSFGSQVIGTSSTAKFVTVSNSGSIALTINSITITGNNTADFVQTNTCGSSLAPSLVCTVSISFRPGSSGAKKASLTVSTNAAAKPVAVTLAGTGKKR